MGARLLMTLVAAVEETVGKASLAKLKVRRPASESAPSTPPGLSFGGLDRNPYLHAPLSSLLLSVAPCRTSGQPLAVYTVYYTTPEARARLLRRLLVLCPCTRALPLYPRPARPLSPARSSCMCTRARWSRSCTTSRRANTAGAWVPTVQCSRLDSITHAHGPASRCSQQLSTCARTPPRGLAACTRSALSLCQLNSP